MDKIKEYVLESYDELMNRVVWPTWAELQESTIVVLSATIILSLVLFAMDKLANGLLQNLYSVIRGIL
jgi:preprotein translocase subunit SecE